jgi:hypothetical protein
MTLYYIEDLPKRFDSEEIYSAIDFVMKELDMDNVDDLHVHIKWKKTLDDNVMGQIWPEIEFKKYYIEVKSNMQFNNTVRTLFHEMVHLKQYVKNELHHSYPSCNVNKWIPEKAKTPYRTYKDMPWEIEAYAKQDILYEKYLQSTH